MLWGEAPRPEFDPMHLGGWVARKLPRRIFNAWRQPGGILMAEFIPGAVLVLLTRFPTNMFSAISFILGGCRGALL